MQTDRSAQAAREVVGNFPRLTARIEDFEHSVNQCRLVLERAPLLQQEAAELADETSRGGVEAGSSSGRRLKVLLRLEHSTRQFSHYRVVIRRPESHGGNELVLSLQQHASPHVLWLSSGLTVIEAVAVNSVGRGGCPSALTVALTPSPLAAAQRIQSAVRGHQMRNGTEISILQAQAHAREVAAAEEERRSQLIARNSQPGSRADAYSLELVGVDEGGPHTLYTMDLFGEWAQRSNRQFTHSLTLTHSHTHTHSLSLSLSLSRSFVSHSPARSWLTELPNGTRFVRSQMA